MHESLRRLSVRWSSYSSDLTQPVKARWTKYVCRYVCMYRAYILGVWVLTPWGVRVCFDPLKCHVHSKQLLDNSASFTSSRMKDLCGFRSQCYINPHFVLRHTNRQYAHNAILIANRPHIKHITNQRFRHYEKEFIVIGDYAILMNAYCMCVRVSVNEITQ